MVCVYIFDLIIKKNYGMTRWNKEKKKSTSINKKHTNDHRHTTSSQNIQT